MVRATLALLVERREAGVSARRTVLVEGDQVVMLLRSADGQTVRSAPLAAREFVDRMLDDLVAPEAAVSDALTLPVPAYLLLRALGEVGLAVGPVDRPTAEAAVLAVAPDADAPDLLAALQQDGLLDSDASTVSLTERLAPWRAQLLAGDWLELRVVADAAEVCRVRFSGRSGSRQLVLRGDEPDSLRFQPVSRQEAAELLAGLLAAAPPSYTWDIHDFAPPAGQKALVAAVRGPVRSATVLGPEGRVSVAWGTEQVVLAVPEDGRLVLTPVTAAEAPGLVERLTRLGEVATHRPEARGVQLTDHTRTPASTTTVRWFTGGEPRLESVVSRTGEVTDTVVRRSAAELLALIGAALPAA